MACGRAARRILPSPEPSVRLHGFPPVYTPEGDLLDGKLVENSLKQTRRPRTEAGVEDDPRLRERRTPGGYDRC